MAIHPGPRRKTGNGQRLTLPAALALAMVAHAAGAAAQDAALTAALQGDVARYVAARTEAEHISAVSVSVSLHGAAAPIDVVSGTTTYGGSVPATAANLFQIGSQTKAFTAVVMLQLEAEGRLRLDQTLGEFLPQYKAWSGATVRSLLNMTSGIPEYADNPRFLTALAADPNRRWTLAEVVSCAEPGSPGAPAPPTQKWHYSNTNYLLAQMIIERVTGDSLQHQIEQRLLGPRYGLTDTFYSPDHYPDDVVARMVSGYFFNRSPGNEALAPLLGRDMKDASVSTYQGAGGMVSRPADITRWARALYRGGMLPDAQRREMMQLVSERTGLKLARPTRTDANGFGLGVSAFNWPGAGPGWYYFGESLGYRMFYAWFPRSDTVIAIGLNSQPSADAEYRLRNLIEALVATLHRSGRLRRVGVAPAPASP